MEQIHKETLKYLSNLLKPPKKPICIKSIKEQINLELNSNYSEIHFMKLIKYELNYTWKKGWPRAIKFSKPDMSLLEGFMH